MGQALYSNACNYWRRMNPDDDEGAHHCACGAVIIYQSLCKKPDVEDETEEEQTANEFVKSCFDVTAMGGTKYVAHYRAVRRGHSEQYAVVYAGNMLFIDDCELAHDCARFSEQGISAKYINDRRFDWMISKRPEEIMENCLLAGDGDLEPDDFSPSVCEDCERDDCDWHPDTLAEEEPLEADEDNDQDPEAW